MDTNTHRMAVTLVLGSLLLCSFSADLWAQTWDAKADWSDVSNPNGVWSYRDATNGNLFLPTAEGWSLDGPANLFDDQSSIVQLGNEFGGHGPWMVRWTSPIDGFVEVSGSMLQLFEPQRRMKFELRQNGVTFAEGLVPVDEFGETVVAERPGAPVTRDGLVNFGPNVRQVNVGDTIEYAAVASGLPEPPDAHVPTFVVASFSITVGCTLNVRGSYADGTLDLLFQIGTRQPATWSVFLFFSGGVIPLWSVALPVVDVSFPVPIPGFPQIGTVAIVTMLTTREEIACIDFEIVHTGTPQ